MHFFVAGSKSAEEFAKVKAGLDGGGSLPVEYLWYFFIGLALVVLASVAVSAVRRRRAQAMFQGWTTVSEPQLIAAILTRAAGRQADCNLEIFDKNHEHVYRGFIYEARPGTHLLMELARLPGQGLEFDDLPAQAHLNFRPGPKEKMEHYQFSSHTLGLSYQREKNWRAARVIIAWPKCVISAQRRDFLRMEPLGQHAITARLLKLPDNFSGRPEDLDQEQLAAGEVMDLSIGGLQLVLPARSEIIVNQHYLAELDLPMAGLDLDLKNTKLYLLFQPLARDLISEAGGEDGAGQVMIRGGFTGRYRPQPDTGLWDYCDFSPESFQDLAHWINAYQRYLLKKERGQIPVPEERVNIYPAEPPQRPEPKDEG